MDLEFAQVCEVWIKKKELSSKGAEVHDECVSDILGRQPSILMK
jgi:hypothetical protein